MTKTTTGQATMTEQEARDTLSDVRVKLSNSLIEMGQVSGRLNRFATVTVYGGGDMSIQREVSWELIARAVSTDAAIIF